MSVSVPDPGRRRDIPDSGELRWDDILAPQMISCSNCPHHGCSEPTVETVHRREVPSIHPHFADKDRCWAPSMYVVSPSSIRRCSGPPRGHVTDHHAVAVELHGRGSGRRGANFAYHRNRTAVRSKLKEASMGLVVTLIGAIAPLPVVQPRSAGHVGPAMTSIALEVHPGQRKVDAS